MTDRKQRLAALADRVEQLQGPDREVDALIWCALHGVRYKGHYPAYGKPDETQVEFTQPPKRTSLVTGTGGRLHAKPYTASLDAAMTLVPGDWNWVAGDHTRRGPGAIVENGELFFIGVGSRPNPARRWFEVRAESPALALCAAALRAQSETVA